MIPTLESVINLKLADPNFNSPGRIDVLLGADVPEDVMKEGKLKENGLHIRNSFFGLSLGLFSRVIKATQITWFMLTKLTLPNLGNLKNI